MSTMSFLDVVRRDSWRPSFRRYRRKLLGKSDKNGLAIEGEKTFVIEKTGRLLEKNKSGVVIEAVLPEDGGELVKNSLTTKVAAVHSALRVVRNGVYELSHTCPIPEFMADDEVMIRNHATGLNPIDWKSVDFNFCLPEFPWVRTSFKHSSIDD